MNVLVGAVMAFLRRPPVAEFIAYNSFDITTEFFPISADKGAKTRTYEVSFVFSGKKYTKSVFFDYINDTGNKSVLLGGADLGLISYSATKVGLGGTEVKLLIGYSDFWSKSPVANYALVGSFGPSMWNELLHGVTEDDPAAIFAEVLKGADLINLSAGADVMRGFAGNDVINGNDGEDTLLGDSGNDRISGGNGADFLSGDAGNDVLIGGAGDDALVADAGNDVLSGGAGVDTAYYNFAAAGVVVNLGLTLAQDTAGGGKDRLNTIENLVGSAFSDQLTGSSVDNLLSGLGGDDVLLGMDGNDVLRGGIGVNALDGGAGSDTADYGASISGIALSLKLSGAQKVAKSTTDTLSGIENVIGSRFPDQIRGDDAANVISGEEMADKIYGAGGNDTIYGSAVGGTGSDGNNKLYGQDGNDTLLGAGGQDYLAGGNGADILDGKANSDVLIGGKGADRFVMAFEYLPDQIVDFTSAQGDKIQLSLGAGSDGLAFVFATKVGGTLSDAEFYAAPGANAAHDASDRIIYDSATGELFFDADGTGTDSLAQQIAVFASLSIFDPAPVLAASDFQIVV